MPSPSNCRLLIVATLLLACRTRGQPAFVHLAEARRLVAEMRVDLAKASNATDRAVLADTDQDSTRFAHDAEAAMTAVRADVRPLDAHLAALAHPGDDDLLGRFLSRLEDYRKLDHEILTLAVENTNLKAQRLLFGPVRRAADDFCDALRTAVSKAPTAARCRAGELASGAELAVREIQILQAPHIAEAQDAEMDRLEKEMSSRRATAAAALKSWPELGPAATAPLQAAQQAWNTFETLSAQLIALSRRNSNVRSLQLALRQQPGLSAACDEALAALQDALAKQGFSGTR